MIYPENLAKGADTPSGKRSAKEKIVTSDQLAWLAGFTDGEGSLCITVHPGSKLTKVPLPFISCIYRVGNVHIEPIERVKSIGSELIRREIRYSLVGNGKDRRPLYVWQLKKLEEILVVVGAIKPYLTRSLPHADLLLRYAELGTHPRITEETSNFVSGMKHLNRRYARGEWESSQRETERLALGTPDEETARTAGRLAEVGA